MTTCIIARATTTQPLHRLLTPLTRITSRSDWPTDLSKGGQCGHQLSGLDSLRHVLQQDVARFEERAGHHRAAASTNALQQRAYD
jgi:hypothetical protein